MISCNLYNAKIERNTIQKNGPAKQNMQMLFCEY
jgi:hypothetical protein